MEEFGASSAAIDAAVAQEREGLLFDVYAENLPMVRAFVQLGTQWRVAALGMEGRLLWIGLDYAAIETLPDMRHATPKRYAETFSALRVMEAAARNVLNERKSDDG
jgi:hypothetical protein